LKVRRGTLYLADLSPSLGTEAGKTRPVLVIQSDLLNETGHPSTWILPCTTRLTGQNMLRIPLPKGMAGNREDCEIMIDQSRAIDNRRFVRMLKPVPRSILREAEDQLRHLAEL
jgi:mRNA interferase MazF